MIKYNKKKKDGVYNMIMKRLVNDADENWIKEEKERLVNGRDNVNEDRVADILYGYKALQDIILGKDVKISYSVFEPTDGMGCVSVEGKSVECKETSKLKAVIDLATNFEVYPKVNGTIQMNFTFHGLRGGK